MIESSTHNLAPIQVETSAWPMHRLGERRRGRLLRNLGDAVMWVGLAGALWSGFESYRHVARIQEQLRILWVHPRLGGTEWNAVYFYGSVMMGCLVVSCIGGLLSHFGKK